MERRSERLAILQKLKPISYRETGVKRVFKKIRRKRKSAAETKQGHTTWKANKPREGWGMRYRESDDSEEPCCSKGLVDQRHLLLQHTLENPPLMEPNMDVTTHQDPQPLVVETHPRPFKMKLSFLTLIFILGISFRFMSGFSSPPNTLKQVMMKVQLSHQNAFLQQNLQKQIDAFRQQVSGLQNFVDALGSAHANWEARKHLFMQAGGSKSGSKYIPKEDFALKSAGASVVKFSKSFKTGAQVCMLGLCWDYSRSPDVILERDNNPGNCWAMDGSQGYIIIKLSKPVCPISVALDHISKKISHTGEISSAPQNFSVYGFKDDFEKEEGNSLGSFVYKIDGYPTQMFKLEGTNLDTFQYLLLKISSNWNNPNYTCIYGFRVYDS